MTVPSSILSIILSHGYQQLRANPAVAGAFHGVVAAAVGMMAAAAWLLVRSQFGGRIRWRCFC